MPIWARSRCWIQDRYRPEGGVHVTENGCVWIGNSKEESVNDDFAAMHETIQHGADVRSYFAWSFIDNYKWTAGYSKRFGITSVDYETFECVPKKSALWYGAMIPSNGVDVPE